MDVDEIMAGLSPADRAALLERLLSDGEMEDDEDELDARVRRLEAMVGGVPGWGPRSARRYRRGPGFAGEPGPWGHHHCHGHCPHCGW